VIAAAVLLLASSAFAAAGPLDPPPGTFAVEVAETKAGPEWTETVLRFPSPVKSPWPANDTVWAHLVVPKGAAERRPAVLVLPVMAAPNVWIETRFVERFARDGLVVMWLEMPTQFHRRPDPSEPSGQVFLARTPKRLAANFRQSILDARRALGVLSARPEVDSRRLAMFGVSLGALVGSVVYSVDPRPRYAVFLLGGADMPSLVIDGSLTGPFARKMGLRPEELRAAWAGLDALDYRASNADKPVLLVNARSDTVIPRANALKLAEAFPAARQVWLPFGHYTGIVHLVWLPRWISARLRGGLSAARQGDGSGEGADPPHSVKKR
jgi:dienelactone hydrolase